MAAYPVDGFSGVEKGKGDSSGRHHDTGVPGRIFAQIDHEDVRIVGMTTRNPHLGESKLDLIVLSRRDAAEGVVVLELGLSDGADLPAWEPGAHIDLELANGMIRQYSLCGPPSVR